VLWNRNFHCERDCRTSLKQGKSGVVCSGLNLRGAAGFLVLF
jgi:hypothetical protein